MGGEVYVMKGRMHGASYERMAELLKRADQVAQSEMTGFDSAYRTASSSPFAVDLSPYMLKEADLPNWNQDLLAKAMKAVVKRNEALAVHSVLKPLAEEIKALATHNFHLQSLLREAMPYVCPLLRAQIVDLLNDAPHWGTEL